MANYTSTINIYNSWKEYMNEGANCGSDSFVCLLTTSTHTPDSSSHSTISDITNEVSGNGYARQTLTVATSAQSGGTYTLDLSDPVFSASGGSIVAMNYHVFDDTLAGDPLVCWGKIDSTAGGTNVTTTSGNSLTIQINSSGLYTIA